MASDAATRQSSPRVRALRVAILALLAAATAHGASQAASCPVAVVLLGRGATPFAVDSPSYDSTYTAHNVAHATFDRTQARMSLACSSGGGLSASLRIVERFDLAGVPSGTMVNAVLEFQLDGWAEQSCGGAGCGMEFEGRMAVGADSVSADANQIGPGTVHHDLVTTLSLPVTFLVGTPVEAAFYLGFGTGPGQTGATAQASCSYRVRGLPPGVRAIACMGADVTPARRTTWGSLKQLYR